MRRPGWIRRTDNYLGEGRAALMLVTNLVAIESFGTRKRGFLLLIQ
jgi:hypothetical protein